MQGAPRSQVVELGELFVDHGHSGIVGVEQTPLEHLHLVAVHAGELCAAFYLDIRVNCSSRSWQPDSVEKHHR